MRVHAAGSLRSAFAQAAEVFGAAERAAVELEFGPSGVLRERIAAGEPADVFASANMGHPRALAEAGLSGPVVMFARNRLCALARTAEGITSSTLLDRMLDPATRLATSTPGSGPSGDYAWKLFERAGEARRGAREALERKAMPLVGGSRPSPDDGHREGALLVANGGADIFVTYSTSAMLAMQELPSLQAIALPEALAVAADYGLVVLKDAAPAGQAFARFLLGNVGQAILAGAGFAPPAPGLR